jgi:tRNA U55 pseudouridine synthase TruB
MGYGGHMVHLQRCHVGSFCLKQAHTLDSLERLAQEGNLANHIVPLARALDFIPELSVSPEQFRTLQTAQGRALSTILGALCEPTTKATSYRLRIGQTEETFAVIHRHTTDSNRWKLSYLEDTLGDKTYAATQGEKKRDHRKFSFSR